jgi:hypothetical protein
MKKNWKIWLGNCVLVLSLFFISIWISGNYDYVIDDDGIIFSVSMVIIVSYLWKKINNKCFK